MYKKPHGHSVYIVQVIIILFVILITAPALTVMAANWSDLVKNHIYMENSRTLNGKAFLNLPVVDATVLIYDKSGTLISLADVRTCADGSFSLTQLLPETFSIIVSDGWLDGKPFDHDLIRYIDNFRRDDFYVAGAVTTIAAEYQDRHPELTYKEIEVLVAHFLFR